MESDKQITKVPEGLEAAGSATLAKTARVKDPKKVAAGKALAKKNREAREALKKLEEMEANKAAAASSEPVTFKDADGWLMAAAGVAGGCLTLYHAYNLFFPSNQPKEKRLSKPSSPPERKQVTNEVKLRPKESTLVKTGELIDME